MRYFNIEALSSNGNGASLAVGYSFSQTTSFAISQSPRTTEYHLDLRKHLMPESIHSTSASQIPSIPEPVVLTWTSNFDEGDEVAYIAGAPPPLVAPPPSFASNASMTTLSTIREHPLPPLPPPPPPPSWASEATPSPSTVSLAHATIGDHDTNSRRVSMLSQPSMVLGATTTTAMENLLPDSHLEDQVPTQPMTYIFTPMEEDSEAMILIPSPDTTSNSGAVYHIKVTHDLFDPSFFITTIRKGGTSNGRLVGDFTTKQDCSAFEETVYFNNIENRIFTKLTAVKKDEYQWKMRGGAELLLWKWDKNWTCQHIPAQSPSKTKRYPIIARFFPYVLRSPSNPHKIAHMIVQPSGQIFFDDIILSLLIVERKRKKLTRR